jgi:hypothetical protein
MKQTGSLVARTIGGARGVHVGHGQGTAGYLSFGPAAQCVVHALKGKAWLAARQAFSRTLRSQKTEYSFSGSKT